MNHNFIKSYLRRLGFVIKPEQTPCYLLRNILDFVFAFVYYGMSIGCVIRENASLVVLILNAFCLMRMILKNSLRQSEITDYYRYHSALDEYYTVRHPFARRIYAELFFGAWTFIFLVSSEGDVTGCWIKLIICITMLLVFLNELEDIWIYTYDASANYKE